MTDTGTHRASGVDQTRPGRSSASALSHLVPDARAFAANAWGRRALLTSADDLPGDLDGLFGEDAVDELIAERGLRTPFLRVARNGSTLPTGSFTSGGGVGAGIADQLDDTRLSTLFAEGATLVLQALHRTWAPVADFTKNLAEELGHPVQVNAYVTPPQSRGFDDHYDVHDVFVLQVSGEKRWRIHEPVHPAPLRDQPWTDRREAVAEEADREPVIDAVLRPGDCLYLPRGFLHAATALGDVSTHLTFGVHTWTRHGLAGELVDRAVDLLADDVDVRGSLPLGVDVGDPRQLDEDVALVRERLHAALDAVSTQELARRLGLRSDGTSRPAPVGPLSQLRASQQIGEQLLTLTLRSHLDARWEGDRLVTRAGVVEVDAVDRDTVQRLLDGQTWDVAPDDDAAAELARRLLAAGVLRPV